MLLGLLHRLLSGDECVDGLQLAVMVPVPCKRSMRFSLQDWYCGDSEDLGTDVYVIGIFAIREIGTNQDYPGSDRCLV